MGGHDGGQDSPIRLLIIAQQSYAQAFYTAFAADARYAVQAVATSPEDARAKLTLNPEAVLCDAAVFNGPMEFSEVLSAYRGTCYVVTPAALAPADLEAVQGVPCVKKVIQGQANLPALAGDLYATAAAQRRAVAATPDAFLGGRLPQVASVGWRAIAVWSPQGGVGKSTVAQALALEATQRHLPTLLVGLAAPDVTPLILEGPRPEPNLLSWRSSPTVDGLRNCVQVHRVTGLHVLIGFRDPLELEGYDPESGPAGLTNLAYTAAQAGYGILIFDVSAQEFAPAALSVANTLVLVARPDIPGIYAVLEAVRLVRDVMAGQHAIPDAAIYLVLNRVRNTSLTPEEFVREGKRVRPDMPALAAAIHDDPNIDLAINQRQAAYFRSDTLRSAAHVLGDLLFPSALERRLEPAAQGKVLHLGPLRVRLT